MEKDMKPTIGIIGIGKLGLCFSLNLENVGYKVIGVDVSEDYVKSINEKTYDTDEPLVKYHLNKSKNFIATTDYSMLSNVETIFVLVATPSLPDGSYDHSQIENSIENLLNKSGGLYQLKRLIIGCTTMPGYCDELQQRIALARRGYRVSYNPEFIAQGTIMKNQLTPDIVLIGSYDDEDSDEIISIYEKMTTNQPEYCVMSPKEAEITKIALNCFLTTKIAYANYVGDVALASGVRPEKILKAIGKDKRVGSKYLDYGFGFGGPCFPRDNRAFGLHSEKVGIEPIISNATDISNQKHLQNQVRFHIAENTGILMLDYVTYKPESTLTTESQRLKFAQILSSMDYEVIVSERSAVIKDLEKDPANDKIIFQAR